jgi:acetyl esterase/lipase
VIGGVPLGGLLLLWCTLMAVAPIRHPRRLGLMSWICSAGPNEVPFLFIYIVVLSNAPSVFDGEITRDDWISSTVAVVTLVGLGIVARRALRTGAIADAALENAFGARWLAEIDTSLVGRPRRRLPWFRILLVAWPFRPRAVERVANIPYGQRGRENLLDVYRHRSHPASSPTLIYFHGGKFRRGRKNFEARPLIHHLANQGWTCISANYHLSPTPAEGFPDHLIDAKRVIAWARTEGHRHGVDPDAIFVAGSSAGAHLTMMAALTANDPSFQPGFETSDTTVAGGIGLYGYYGALGGDEDPPSTPLAYVHEGAPPLFVIHGDNDTFTPAEGARLLVNSLRTSSAQPVVYAELRGAQHSFDVFHSIRFDTAVNAIEAFAASIRTQRDRDAHARSFSAPPHLTPGARRFDG